MDPSIMKLLEEDEDETMHSGADVEAFTAALNRHIKGGDGSLSQPADGGNSHSSNQFVDWKSTNHSENTLSQSLQDSNVTLQQSYNNNSSEMELKQMGQDAGNQHQNDSSKDVGQLSTHEQPMQNSDKNTVPILDHSRTQNPDPQYLEVNTQQPTCTAITGQHSMAVGTNNLQQKMTSQTEMVSMTGSQSAGNVHQPGKQVPFAMLFPHIQPLLDKDRAMQLQALYHRLRKNEITKDGFVKHMRNLIGDQMLKMAVFKFQSQAAREAQYGHANQFPPVSQVSMQQHMQSTSNDSSNLVINNNNNNNNAQKLHEGDHHTDLHGLPGSQVSTSNLAAIKQEREHPTYPMQGLNNHQQKHFHYPQASFSSFGHMGNNFHPYPPTNSLSMPTTLKSQPQDHHIRPTQLGPGSQTLNMTTTPKFERQNSFGEQRIPVAQMTSSISQQGSPHWQSTGNNERRSVLPSSMINAKAEPTDQLHDQQLKSQLSSPSFTPVQNESGASTLGTLNDETYVQPSTAGFLTAGQRVAQTSGPISTPSHVDTSNSMHSNTFAVTSPSGPGNNAKNLSKKPSIGQKKQLEVLGSSPPPSGKKQKVSGGFSDQSIEQLNDVTAVSGVNLREEEEQLFSGPKEDSRVSEASRRAVQEEEEQLILQKTPLQKKLTEIMGKSGLMKMSNDHVERCLSLCVEERLRALISTIIRLSKQRADIEKTRHRTIVTSDVRQQIMAMNRKAREEWEKKQVESDKHQDTNEPDGSTAAESDKDRDDGQAKSLKVNKEDDDKMRTTAANVAARAAVGGDDMLSKWQLMAEQAKQKRDAASGSHHSKDFSHRLLSSSTRNPRDFQDVERRSSSTAVITQGDDRSIERNQIVSQTKAGCCSITVKDVIAVLEREPQMSKSTLVYRLYERIPSDASLANE